ncbi:unnamed protein product [Phytophthora fragariaefolia]|uniref:Unnamed protein product n=1 Tax=Phytophthora fragariaefolia TaxID=1490495 RepID=A0A9W6XZA3_9STRA|nr:unnamed protein product [Phytophthora fragariaefolia]
MEQVPGSTLLCVSVAAARSNLVVVTASVKGYPEPMTILIDSGASFNFATKASVARNDALYASGLEASESNTNVSVRLATGSIVSTRKVTIPLNVKIDDFDSVEPFIVLDMDDRYDLILGMPWLAKHEPWIDWRSRTIGAGHNPLAYRALAGHVPSTSRGGFVHEHRVPRDERQFAGSSEFLELPTPPPPPTQSGAAGSGHVEEGAGVVTRANKSGRVGTPTTQGVVAGSARATEGAGACSRATTGGRAGAPTSKVIRGDKVTSTTKAEASGRDADSATEDRVPQVLDVFTGEPKVEEVLTPLPTVAELLELEELSYVEFVDSLKAGELAEVVLLRPEGGSLELNSSSVMGSEVLEDERTSRRQTRYGAAVLKDPSDLYYPLLKDFSDVVSDDPPSVLPPDRGVGNDIDLVPGTKYCTTRQWPHPKEQVDVIDAFFAAKHAAGMVRESKSPHSSPTFCLRKPNGKWRMADAFNKLNAATIPATDLRKWLGLANYLHKYSDNYAEMARPLTNLLKKDAVWSVTSEAQQALEAITNSLQSAPRLALPDEDRPFSVVCDASDFAIGSALLQADAEGRERVVSFQSRQLKAAEKNYPGHDKELLAMKYALVKFRVHLLGQKPFVIYTDHASLRGATSSPYLSQRMARWLSFFAELWLAHLAYLESPLYELIRKAYAADDDLAGLVEALGVPNKTIELSARQRSRLHRYSVVEGLLYYQVDGGGEPRIFVPNDVDLRHRVLYEAHDTPLSGHLRQEKTTHHGEHAASHVEFALNNAVHSSTGFTPFYVNGLRHPRTPLTLPPASNLGGGEANAEDSRGLKGLRTSVNRNLLSFIETGETVRQRVRDAMAAAQDRQKENSDRHGRANTQVFQVGDQVLLNAKNLPIPAVSAVGSTKLRPRFIGPFTVVGVHGHAYTLDLPSAMATHPTFYVGLLKPYHPAAAIDLSGSVSPSIDEGHSPSLPAAPLSQEPGLWRIAQHGPLGVACRGSPRYRHARRASGSSRDARTRNVAPPRRSPRIATVGTSPDPVLDHRGPPAQAIPAHGAAGDASPRELLDQPQRGTRQSEDAHAASLSPPTGHPAVADSFPRPIAGHPDSRSLRQAGHHHAVPACDAERLGQPPHRAPPPLLGTGGVPNFHVEKILRRRGRSGNYEYLVKWRGYPDSDSSWEPGSRLEEDCADLVTAFEQAHGAGRR